MIVKDQAPSEERDVEKLIQGALENINKHPRSKGRFDTNILALS